MSTIGFITIGLLLLGAAALGQYRHDQEKPQPGDDDWQPPEDERRV
jgi:hypothetical protein